MVHPSHVPKGVLRHNGYMGTWFRKMKVNVQHTFYLFFYMIVINIITKRDYNKQSDFSEQINATTF